jgi:hypothetical protein
MKEARQVAAILAHDHGQKGAQTTSFDPKRAGGPDQILQRVLG